MRIPFSLEPQKDYERGTFYERDTFLLAIKAAYMIS
jgi:hypothetical protein